MKRKLAAVLALILVFTTCFSAFGETVVQRYSVKWTSSVNGKWQVKDRGVLLKNTWILDDECDEPEGLWYLLDENGDLVTDQLVSDGAGHYYSFNDLHDGHYGAMRTADGIYGGIALTFNHNHDGYYGAVTEAGGIEKLRAKFGVREFAGMTGFRTVKMSEVSIWIPSGNDDPEPEDPEPEIKYYKLSFDLSGVTVTTPSAYKTVRMREGAKIEKPATPSDVSGKKEFVSWLDPDGEACDFDIEDYYISANTKLKADWKEKNVPAVMVSSVRLTPTEMTLTAGETGTIGAVVKPSDATNRELEWESDDGTVAEVNDEGEVTAIVAGTAVITARATDGSGKKATCTVTVVPVAIPVTGITLNKTVLELTAGEEETLTATVLPEDATNKGISWSSGDEDVAAVSADGKVTAVAAGSTVITAAAKDGSGITAECALTVVSVPVTEITLDRTQLELNMDAEDTLTATVLPAEATEKGILWSSSDEETAVVDENGKITPLKVGTAVITAEAKDGSGVKEECAVDVMDYLCFTAETDGAKITFNYISGTDVQYRKRNDAGWTDCASGTAVTLTDAGDKVYFRGKNVITYANNNTKKFSMEGKVAGSGSVTSLTDGKGSADASLSPYCYKYMFSHCTGLTAAPALPAETLAPYCYNSMFTGCTGLTAAPALPAENLAESCYNSMFYGCTGLTAVPELPAETLAPYCYCYMFFGCTGLTAAPALPPGTLAEGCYEGMFCDCTGLEAAPALNAGTLAKSCYANLFSGCTGLTAAPTLPAENLAESCYANMFSGCTGLTAAPELPAETLAQSCYDTMFKGCTGLTTAPDLPADTLASGCYAFMFTGCTGLTAAPALPAENLAESCYSSMFSGCTGLTAAPTLPAENLAESCYSSMFSGCTGLTAAPELPAETLENFCYMGMFSGCTGLTAAPELPAETLSQYCYDGMFTGCTGLTAAPALPAENLAELCYQKMFFGCTGLEAAPVLPAVALSDYCYRSMFSGCTGLTAAPDLPADTLASGCYVYMFSGCTGLTAAPVLSAETLENFCYMGMFSGCTSLKIAQGGSTGTKIFTCPSIAGISYPVYLMFKDTGGTFTGEPAAGNTYYYY